MTQQGVYKLPVRHRVARWVLSQFAHGIYKIFARSAVFGLENVPQKGPYVVVFNHISIFDPPFVLTHLPEPPTPIGAAEVWREKDKALLAFLWGGIPIDRDNYHREPLAEAVRVLEAGYPVALAPEGRLSREPGLRRGKLGLAMILEKIDVPIVPVGVVGSTMDFLDKVKKFQRPEISMRIGKPFRVAVTATTLEDRKAAYQQAIDRVMAHIAMTLPEEYRGFYSDYETYL
jgi:1-acyl-sn-glycerol-3-phosphate acyltransferase